MSRGRILSLTREALLTSTAVLGALCVVLTALAFALGIHPLLFRSGSMSPTIGTGDIAFARTVDAKGLHRGDIVSLVAPSGERVTHRVVDNTGSGAHRTLTLKGDANDVIDPQAYQATRVQKVFVHVPKVGYAVSWLSRPPGVYLVAAYVALMLLLIGRKDRPEDSAPTRGGASGSEQRETDPVLPVAVPGKRRRARPRAALAVAVALVASVVAVAAWSMPTWAAWNDNVAVTGQNLTTGTWGAPPAPHLTVGSCTTGNGSTPYNFAFTWSGTTTNPDRFILRFSNPSLHPDQTIPATDRTGATVAINNEAGQFWVVAVVANVESIASNKASYAGNGGGKSCTVAP